MSGNTSGLRLGLAYLEIAIRDRVLRLPGEGGMDENSDKSVAIGRFMGHLPGLIAVGSVLALVLSFLFQFGYFLGRNALGSLDYLSLADLIDHSAVPLALATVVVLAGWCSVQLGLHAASKRTEKQELALRTNQASPNPLVRIATNYVATISLSVFTIITVFIAWGRDWSPAPVANIFQAAVLTLVFWSVDRRFPEVLGMRGLGGHVAYLLIMFCILYPLGGGIYLGAAAVQCPSSVWIKTTDGPAEGKLIRVLNRGVLYAETRTKSIVLVPWSEIKRYAETSCTAEYKFIWPWERWQKAGASIKT